MRLAPHKRMLAAYGDKNGLLCGACAFYQPFGETDHGKAVGRCERYRVEFTTIDSSRLYATPKWSPSTHACGAFERGEPDHG